MLVSRTGTAVLGPRVRFYHPLLVRKQTRRLCLKCTRLAPVVVVPIKYRAAKSMSRTALLPGDFPSPWTASSASFPAHRRPYDLNRLPSGADRPLRALEHLHHEWPGMALERQPGHTWRHAASREASLARPWWSGKTAPAQRRRGNPHYHKLTAASCVRFKQLGEASCALCPLTRSAPLQPHASAPLDRCRARTPAGESVC